MADVGWITGSQLVLRGSVDARTDGFLVYRPHLYRLRTPCQRVYSKYSLFDVLTPFTPPDGVTTTIFESTPVYPTPARFWETVAKHKLTQFYTGQSPTICAALASF